MARSYHQVKSDKPYIHDEESHYPKDCKVYKEPQIPSSFEERGSSYDYQNPETTANPIEYNEPSVPIEYIPVEYDELSAQKLIEDNNRILKDIDKKIEKILKILKKYLPK